MKLTLIRSSEIVAKGANALITPPVGVAYLAAAARAAGHEVVVIDGVGEGIGAMHRLDFLPAGLSLRGLSLREIVDRIPPSAEQVIGVSCMFSQDWPANRRLVEMVHARFPEATIVLGGEHVSALPDFVLETCPAVDFCVVGEGETSLVRLLEELERGEDADYSTVTGLRQRTRSDSLSLSLTPKASPRIREPDTLPWPAWDLVPIENYLASGASFGLSKGRNMPIVATRGCPYACTFCSNPSMWGPQWVARDPVRVVDEMAAYVERYRVDSFDFYDLTAIVRKDWILAFCAELERRKLKISFQLPSGTRSEAIDAEVAAALARTGCCHIVYAPESGSERVLKLVNKKVRLPSLFESMRASVSEGLFVKMNIVIGFPGESFADHLRTLGFLAHAAWIGVHDAFVYTFSPYPGSRLFRELRERGRIPELNDEYFFGLSSYIRLGSATSYAEGIPSAWLAFLRVFGLSWFYLLSFAFYPLRPLRIIRNLGQADSNTRIEAFAKLVLRRWIPARSR
jgi:radical SAM superfamily enzyme YgiQ (UPF0313 family)